MRKFFLKKNGSKDNAESPHPGTWSNLCWPPTLQHTLNKCKLKSLSKVIFLVYCSIKSEGKHGFYFQNKEPGVYFQISQESLSQFTYGDDCKQIHVLHQAYRYIHIQLSSPKQAVAVLFKCEKKNICETSKVTFQSNSILQVSKHGAAMVSFRAQLYSFSAMCEHSRVTHEHQLFPSG